MQYLEHIYTKKFTYLKFKFNWRSWICVCVGVCVFGGRDCAKPATLAHSYLQLLTLRGLGKTERTLNGWSRGRNHLQVLQSPQVPRRGCSSGWFFSYITHSSALYFPVHR